MPDAGERRESSQARSSRSEATNVGDNGRDPAPVSLWASVSLGSMWSAVAIFVKDGVDANRRCCCGGRGISCEALQYLGHMDGSSRGPHKLLVHT